MIFILQGLGLFCLDLDTVIEQDILTVRGFISIFRQF